MTARHQSLQRRKTHDRRDALSSVGRLLEPNRVTAAFWSSTRSSIGHWDARVNLWPRIAPTKAARGNLPSAGLCPRRPTCSLRRTVLGCHGTPYSPKPLGQRHFWVRDSSSKPTLATPSEFVVQQNVRMEIPRIEQCPRFVVYTCFD